MCYTTRYNKYYPKIQILRDIVSEVFDKSVQVTDIF